MRLDKWLWAARFYKTRRLATEEIRKGRVQVNGEVAKPAKIISVGDRLLIRKLQTLYEIEVKALIEQRGPASVAQTMYEESAESIETRERERELRKLSPMIRPDKPSSREKRQLRNLRQGRYIE